MVEELLVVEKLLVVDLAQILDREVLVLGIGITAPEFDREDIRIYCGAETRGIY